MTRYFNHGHEMTPCSICKDYEWDDCSVVCVSHDTTDPSREGMLLNYCRNCWRDMGYKEQCNHAVDYCPCKSCITNKSS